ncbi:beta family protein [Janthinobacterium aestuarii]
MPILKWKRGEQAALGKLIQSEWDGVVPLLELSPISAAPDIAALNAALPNYVKDVADRITKSVPAEQPIAIDTRYVSAGYAAQLDLMIAVISRLRKIIENPILPIIQASHIGLIPGLTATRLNVLQSFDEIILRLPTSQFESAQIDPLLAELGKVIKRKHIHLLLDQFAIVDKKPADCFNALKPYLVAAAATTCASVTVAGGSFPVNLMGRKQGITDLPRVEWAVWVQIQGLVEYEQFRFSDYTVTNPNPMDEDVDPKKVNPSISLRYASDDIWRLYKGAGFKGAPASVLKSLCKLLTTDAIYSGAGYSFGDTKYMEYANGGPKNGIPWTWRRDATNRHIVHTTKQL